MDREEVISQVEEEVRLGKHWDESDRTIDMELLENVLLLLKEQEPKIGHWILDPDGMDWNIPACTCSECGGRHNGLPIMDGVNEANIYQFAGSQFCPNCGAKMSKEVKWE